ncbi:MAG TPA: hypothetical protein VEK57_03910 [Thermoanaerobaculia bacterium]|nr:hypothetical protein [Thermoanaerobaculia bacterium]
MMTKRVLPLLFVLLCAGFMPGAPTVSTSGIAIGGTVDRFEFNPPRPGENEPVEILLHGVWPSGPPPASPRVTVGAGRIDINFQASYEGPLVVSEWGARVRVGPLDPGIYVVSVLAAGDRIGERVLEVQARPFTVIPTFGSAGMEVLLRGVPVTPECPVGACLQVKFGGIPGESVRYSGPGELLVRTPEHFDTIVDVSVSTPIGDNVTATKAFRFGRAADEADYERVLFPVTFEGRGAHGSDWTTNITVRNDSPLVVATEPLIWLNHHPSPPPAVRDAFPPGGRARFPELSSQAGRFFYIPRGLEPYFSFSSHILDQSRAGTNLGTEIPVVHEDDTSNRIRLVDVPLDPDFRARLRIYDWDSLSRDVRVTVINVLEDKQHNFIVRLNAAVITCPTAPCLQPEPGYAAVDLTAIPELAGAALGDVIIEAETGEARLWAFVSVTNNETQHVTLYTPQHQNR